MASRVDDYEAENEPYAARVGDTNGKQTTQRTEKCPAA